MVYQEGLKLETELEIKNVEVEIKELEIEIFRNNQEIVICKQSIEEKVPEEEIKDYLSGNSSNNIFLTSNIRSIGSLTFRNYCLEDEKFSLMGLKEELENKIKEINEG